LPSTTLFPYTTLFRSTVNATTYQNAGANMIQQLAYTLAHTNEYLNRITGFNKNIAVEITVGGNYFFEIAKLRALRMLLNALADEDRKSTRLNSSHVKI